MILTRLTMPTLTGSRSPTMRPWALVVLVMLGTACNRDIWPRTLELVDALPRSPTMFDLDGDGIDELIFRYQVTGEQGALVLRTLNGNTIDQLNYAGRILPPTFLNILGDEAPEILTPVLRSDSLFVAVASAEGKKLFSFFLASGTVRVEPEGPLPWDPSVVAFEAVDINGDDTNELVTVMMTGFARAPRGVYAHSIPDGLLLGKIDLGGFVTQSVSYVPAGAARPVLLLSTLATNNGGSAGNVDDHHTYIMLVGLNGSPTLDRVREMDTDRGTTISFGDHDRDGTDEILVFVGSPGGDNRDDVRIEVLDAATWRVLRSRAVGEVIFSPVVIDLDRDLRMELLVAKRDEIWMFNMDLDIVRRRTMPSLISAIERWPDIDGDGIDEIAAYQRGGGFFLLDPNLRVKAHRSAGKVSGVMRRGNGVPPALVVIEGETTYTEQLVRTPWFFFWRFGPAVLWVIGLGFVTLMGWLAHAFRQRQQTLRALEAVNTGDTIGRVLMDAEGGIRWANEKFRTWWSAARNGSLPTRFSGFAPWSPALFDFYKTATNKTPPASHRFGQRCRLGDIDGRVALDPIFLEDTPAPWWLFSFADGNRPERQSDIDTWSMMAQRVAHSVRNPLTSILLTLHRLQTEYRERAPAVANRLDPYSNRIEDRIEQLRQLTSNFLKFVDLEEPDLTEVDVNEFVTKFCDGFRRTAPPDIRIGVKLGSDMPKLRADIGQLESVLDNLVANAVNAMPDGGVITLVTSLDNTPLIADENGGQVKIEVMDTGIGIARLDIAKLFDRGFTNSAGGSGLGLAIVKKVIDDHHGRVQVESELGTGSVFSIVLPLQHDIDNSTHPRNNKTSDVPTGSTQ